jgi:hypothetical protein
VSKFCVFSIKVEPSEQKHVQHIAEIPNVVYHHLLKTLGKPSENPKAWKAWLNNSENRDFRTGGGNI